MDRRRRPGGGEDRSHHRYEHHDSDAGDIDHGLVALTRTETISRNATRQGTEDADDAAEEGSWAPERRPAARCCRAERRRHANGDFLAAQRNGKGHDGVDAGESEGDCGEAKARNQFGHDRRGVSVRERHRSWAALIESEERINAGNGVLENSDHLLRRNGGAEHNKAAEERCEGARMLFHKGWRLLAGTYHWSLPC